MMRLRSFGATFIFYGHQARMSKSTPIAQLPFQPQQQPMQMQMQQPPPPQLADQRHTFVNDQQRQMVSQAQSAAQSYSLPQPSVQTDLYDDDATIQEALQSLQQPSPAHHVQQPQPQPQQFAQPFAQPFAHQQLPFAPSQPPQTNAWMPDADDVRTVLLGVVAFVVASILPITAIVSKYVSLDFEYADMVVKAAVVGIAIYVGKRVLVNVV
jgi:hypothetical protein